MNLLNAAITSTKQMRLSSIKECILVVPVPAVGGWAAKFSCIRREREREEGTEKKQGKKKTKITERDACVPVCVVDRVLNTYYQRPVNLDIGWVA